MHLVLYRIGATNKRRNKRKGISETGWSPAAAVPHSGVQGDVSENNHLGPFFFSNLFIDACNSYGAV